MCTEINRQIHVRKVPRNIMSCVDDVTRVWCVYEHAYCVWYGSCTPLSSIICLIKELGCCTTRSTHARKCIALWWCHQSMPPSHLRTKHCVGFLFYRMAVYHNRSVPRRSRCFAETGAEDADLSLTMNFLGTFLTWMWLLISVHMWVANWITIKLL